MAPKQPTNADIFKKLESMDIRITGLESWKIAEDAAKKAVSDYQRGQETGSRRKLFTDMGTFLGVLGLLVWVVIQYISTRGGR